jgi:prepilin-type N-terminal cleavage/methylation domain-containing protein
MEGVGKCRKSTPLRRDTGFTLIELIVVLVIMGIVAGVIVPRYAGSFDSIRFRKTMSEVVTFLREARIGAMAGAGTKHVTLDLRRGIFWNDDKKILRLPDEIEIFTDKAEGRDDETRIFTFYPNGTALEEKIGFVCDKMVAVLHVEPLGGLSYCNFNEGMEQSVRYARGEKEPGDEGIEKEMEDVQTDKGGISRGLDDVDYEDADDDAADEEEGAFGGDDEGDEDTEKDE